MKVTRKRKSCDNKLAWADLKMGEAYEWDSQPGVFMCCWCENHNSNAGRRIVKLENGDTYSCDSGNSRWTNRKFTKVDAEVCVKEVEVE